MVDGKRQAGAEGGGWDKWLLPRGHEARECFEDSLDKLHKLFENFDDAVEYAHGGRERRGQGCEPSGESGSHPSVY